MVNYKKFEKLENRKKYSHYKIKNFDQKKIPFFEIHKGYNGTFPELFMMLNAFVEANLVYPVELTDFKIGLYISHDTTIKDLVIQGTNSKIYLDITTQYDSEEALNFYKKKVLELNKLLGINQENLFTEILELNDKRFQEDKDRYIVEYYKILLYIIKNIVIDFMNQDKRINPFVELYNKMYKNGKLQKI
jgi:hypothetical protein